MRKEVWLVVAIVWSDSGNPSDVAKRLMRYAYVSEKMVELPGGTRGTLLLYHIYIVNW